MKPLVRASIQKDIAGKSVNGLFQKNVQFVNKDNQQAHDYDVKEAEKLLKEAGYHKNSDGIFEKPVNH